MAKQFSPGDGVYDQAGNFYQYVAPAPNGDGHICLPWFESHDQDGAPSDWTGDPVSLREVYSDAEQPKQKAEAKLVELTAKCDAARIELAGIMKERGALDGEIRARAERIKRHEKLRLLDDYIAGKITHFVVVPEYYQKVEVKPLVDALKTDDRYGRDMKLLTLYGDSKGDLQFRINRYSDGGGGSAIDAYPFTSEDEAKAFAKELAAKKLAECIASKNPRGDGIPAGLEGWVKTADEYGVPVPQEWRDKLRSVAIANAERVVAAAAEKLQAAKDYLASLNGGAA